MILKLWITDTTQTIVNFTILIQPIFVLFRLNCHSFWCKKWTWLLFLFCNETKTKEQSQQMKCELISQAMYAESRNYTPASTGISWNAWPKNYSCVAWNASHFGTHFRLVSSPIFQNLLQFLPAILEVLHSMRWPLLLCGYDSTIISSCISIRIEYSASMTQKCDLDWTL